MERVIPMKSFYAMIIVSLAVFLISGCSGSANSPFAPGMEKQTLIDNKSLPVGVSAGFQDNAPSEGMGSLGLFSLHINPANLSAEINSIRSGSLTDVLEVVDITNFLQLAPCSNCVDLKAVSIDIDGNLVVTIGIRHPFNAGDMLKPVTGRNRGDLHVFNIEGIVISNVTGDSFSSLDETIAGFSLVNADGYTGYLDGVLDDIYPTDATVHPYIMHFDDYSQGNYDPMNPMGFESVTTPPPSGNLVMAMGCDFDYKDYVFKIDESTPMDFIFAVGCTYPVAASSKIERFTPEYRIPQHNKKAASEVSYEITENNLGEGDTSSTATIEIHVVDINHGVAVGENLDEMLADSSVGEIRIELPGLMSDILSIDGGSPVSGSGHDPSDPLVYSGTITNTLGAAEGTYTGLIKVIDTYTSGLNQSVLLNGMDGIERVGPIVNPLSGLFEIDEFATYQVFTIDVLIGNLPPVAGTLSLDWECGGDPCSGKPFTLTISEAYDPDGLPVTITWDFDGNLDFADDQDSDDTNLSAEYTYATPGSYSAYCRVSDPTDFTDVGPFDINVLDCTPDDPVIIATGNSGWDPTDTGRGRQIVLNTEDGYAYVMHDNGGGGAISIWDIDPPEDLYEISYVPLGTWRAAVEYKDGYVYTTGQAGDGIIIVDVDPPETAFVDHKWTQFGWATGSMEELEVKDDRLYVASQWYGLLIMDITNPQNPTYLGHSPTTSGMFTTAVEVTDDHQIGFYLEGYWDAASTDWLRVVDISNPASPQVIQSMLMPSYPYRCDLKGDYLYCILHPWEGRQMDVIDVSDYMNPAIVATMNVSNGAWDMQISGNYIYVAGDELTVVDITDPLNPTNLIQTPITGDARGVREYCGIAYVAGASWPNAAPSITIVDLY
jgi:hypothetical protein